MRMKSNNMFRDQVNSVTSCFHVWSTCEQTVVLYLLLKQIPPLQCRFLVEMLQQRINDDKEVLAQEDQANDPGYICSLSLEPKETAIQELLNHLPLLHSGNTKAKNEYLKLIPSILSHSIEHGVFIEESRQLLSYSLIHPAITIEERSKFNKWLCHLDKCFTSNYQSASQLSQGQLEKCQGQIFSSSSENGVQTHIALAQQNSLGTGHLDMNKSEPVNNGLQGHSNSLGNPYGHGNQQSYLTNGGSSGIAGHMLLQSTMSAPPIVTSVVPSNPMPSVNPQNQSLPAEPSSQHQLLRRMHSFVPPNTLPINTLYVSDWLKSNYAHLVQGQHSESEHTPLSPQSSTASSGSGSDGHVDEGPHPLRNTFMEDGSGMRDVPLWLKSLRLHKYAYLFQQLSYEKMMTISQDWLEQQNVTKGARNKIIVSIKKLQERQDVLRNLERDITEGGSLKNCILEMKSLLTSPLKAFTKQDCDSQGSLNSPGTGGDADNTIQEGDIPSQITRLMTKVFTQLMLTNPYDDEGLNMFFQLIDKCINHEAFSPKQKRLLDSFKQKARTIWQPAPVKYGYNKKPTPNWAGNTLPAGTAYGSRPLQRTQSAIKSSPKPSLPSGMQWSFGTKRSVVASTCTMNSGHLPLQRNTLQNTSMLARPESIEQPSKQPLSRTQSAPLRSHNLLYNTMQTPEYSVTDTEINARLDSLCRSVMECALAGSDSNEQDST